MEKNADNGAKCRLGNFCWASSSWLFEIPWLGRPPRGGKHKKTPLGRIPRRGGGNRGPGRPGLRMAAKFFEIEMQIKCAHVKKQQLVMYVNYLAPVTDQKRTCGVDGHPTRSGVNTQFVNVLNLKSDYVQ